MYFSTIKKIVIVLFFMVTPVSAFAAGLGSLNVASALGEPLNATVELLAATPAELASLKAKIDNEAAYSTQGLTRLAIHNDIQVRVTKLAGKDVLKLTSNTPIAEPFLDLLLAAEWSNGRIVRQYTILLDPPNYERNQNQIQAPTTNSFDNASIKKAIPNLNSSSETVKVSSDTTAPASLPQEHLTKRGDTLTKIARRMQPANVSLDKVLVALFEANPEAFDGNNMNRLKVGKILQAPSEEAINAITSKQAAKEIKLQTADWNKYRNKLAEAVAQKVAESNGDDTQSSSGKIKSAAEDQSAPKGAASKDVVKLSATDTKAADGDMQAKVVALQEEISAREKGLKEAEERTAVLEKQIEDMQKLLALKNNAMSNAQEQAAETEGNESKPDAELEVTSEQEAQDSVEANSEVAVENPSVEENPVPAPAKPVTVPPVAEPKEQPSFFASLLGQLNTTILAALAALLAILVAAWLFLRNKRSKKLEDFEQGIMTSGNLKANTVFGDTASGMVVTGDTSFLTDFSHSTGSGLIDTNDVDPIAEAEVYMAYGRDAQAEEILKDAISKEPQRYELHLKLLEMYAANKNTAAFEMVAGELYTTLGADDPTWHKVAEIGAKFEPNNPLYKAKEAEAGHAAEAASFSAELVETELTETKPKQNEPIESQLTENTTLDEMQDAADGSALDASDFSDTPLATEADLDFSISDKTDDEDVVTGAYDLPEMATVNEAPQSDIDKAGPALQFDLDTSVADDAGLTKRVPDLDFPTLQAESDKESAPVMEEVKAETIALDVPSDLTLDMAQSDEDDEIALSDNEASVEDFNFDIDDDDAQHDVSKEANVLDVSGISLDISDDVSFAAEADVKQKAPELKQEVDEAEPVDDLPANEEVETKLELVAAYIDMEDKDGAKELLEEVLKEGNLSQRRRANQILATLT